MALKNVFEVEDRLLSFFGLPSLINMTTHAMSICPVTHRTHRTHRTRGHHRWRSTAKVSTHHELSLVAAGSLREDGSNPPAYTPSTLSRTQLLRSVVALTSLTLTSTLAGGKPALAFSPPPPGYQRHEDKLDGYTFLYPDSWSPVTSSGNDCFYRNSFNAEENLFVDVTSPSSSKYPSIDSLGSPAEVAERLRREYLDEFLSTRIGVRREGKVVDAVRREGEDGKAYYDVRVRIVSYASTSQLAVTFKEVEENMVKEFEREYLTTLGVANERLYSLRIQTSSAKYASDAERLDAIRTSFRVKEVVV